MPLLIDATSLWLSNAIATATPSSVLLAEQAAILELLSGRRLDLSVGEGYRHAEFSGFNIPIEESEARFDEALWREICSSPRRGKTSKGRWNG